MIISRAFAARRLGCMAALMLFALGGPTPVEAQARWQTVDAFLSHGIGLTASESTSLSRGQTVARVLRTGDGRDVAVFGAVRVDVPRTFLMTRQRDVPRTLRTPTRTQVQLFGQPATVADVQAIAVSDDDIKELRTCKPNDCNFKLPASDMERLRKSIDLSTPEAKARATAYVRQRMVEYVAEYRTRGNAAMLVYDDRGSVRASDAFAGMLQDSSFAFSAVPSLGEHLLDYPRHTLAGADEAIFWSIDEMPHLRPVLRITHQIIYTPPDVSGLTLQAAKLIYANHYFESGLEVLAAVDRPEAAGGESRSVTVVAVRRYRFDHLPSGGLLNIKGRVVSSLRDNVVADLGRLKRESEAAFAARSR